MKEELEKDIDYTEDINDSQYQFSHKIKPGDDALMREFFDRFKVRTLFDLTNCLKFRTTKHIEYLQIDLQSSMENIQKCIDSEYPSLQRILRS